MNDPKRDDLERQQKDTQVTLDNHTAFLQEISSKQDAHTKKLQEIGHTLILQRTDILMLQNNVTTLQEDVGDLKHSVTRLESKMDEGFQSVEKRFDSIAEVQKLILDRLPPKQE